MTDYKPGDRVKVEFEGTIVDSGDGWLEFESGENVYRKNVTITRVKPPVPTGFGSVVQLEAGVRLVFDGLMWSGGITRGGHSSVISHSPDEIAKLNFTVIREGI